MKELLLRILIAFHLVYVFALAACAIVLPIYSEWYIVLPIWAFLLRLTMSRDVCPLTLWETKLRRELDWPPLHGRSFFKHYFMWRFTK